MINELRYIRDYIAKKGFVEIKKNQGEYNHGIFSHEVGLFAKIINKEKNRRNDIFYHDCFKNHYKEIMFIPEVKFYKELDTYSLIVMKKYLEIEIDEFLTVRPEILKEFRHNVESDSEKLDLHRFNVMKNSEGEYFFVDPFHS